MGAPSLWAGESPANVASRDRPWLMEPKPTAQGERVGRRGKEKNEEGGKWLHLFLKEEQKGQEVAEVGPGCGGKFQMERRGASSLATAPKLWKATESQQEVDWKAQPVSNAILCDSCA